MAKLLMPYLEQKQLDAVKGSEILKCRHTLMK